MDTEEQIVGDREEIAPLASQEERLQAPAIVVALEAMQRQIDAIQQTRKEMTVTLIGMGFVGGLLFCTILIVLAWLYAGVP